MNVVLRGACRLPGISLLVLGLAAVVSGPALGQPSKINRQAYIYDNARQRMTFSGGRDSDVRADAWMLTISDTLLWSRVTPGATPPERYGHSAIYDPIGDRMVAFGGWVDFVVATNEVWALGLADPQAWTLRTPLGVAAEARAQFTTVRDPLRQRMLIFGGLNYPGGSPKRYNDLWSLSLGDTMRWDRLDPGDSGCPTCRTRPKPRESHSMILDPIRDRLVVFGGALDAAAQNDLWALSLPDTHWTKITALGTVPSTRIGHSAIYDPVGDRMIVFGGQTGTNQYLNDVYSLSLAESTWTRLTPAGPTPEPRSYHAAIYDPIRHAMIVNGGLNYTDDDVWMLTLGPNPTWSPASPVVTPSSTSLDFGTLTMGDVVPLPFTFANGGLQPLYLTTTLPTAEFQFESLPPRKLSWLEQAATRLFFSPLTARSGPDTLFIDSNDPKTPRQRITLRYDVKPLAFASEVLGAPDTVPLGVSFIVTVTPAPDVHLERGTLFFRRHGTSEFDSLALTPLATGFIAAVPAQFVTESGVDYWVRVENHGLFATQPAGAPVAFTTQPVEPPASMLAVPRPNSGVDFLNGQKVEVEVVLPEGARLLSGQVHFRKGGAEGSASDTLGAVLGRPVAVIPDSVVGPRGVEYWIEAHTEHSDLRFPARAPEVAIIHIKVQSLREPSTHAGRRYRLLSVPLGFGNFAGSLDALLNELGPYDPVAWRAYRYDPDSLRTLEFSAARADEFRPGPGRAFWLISQEAHRVDTAPIDGFSTTTGRSFTIRLAPGWNVFANPFDFPVAWSEVTRNAVAVPRGPVAYDPSLGTRGGYSGVTPTLLEPFEGYWIYNESRFPDSLLIPAHEATTGAPTAMESREPSGGPPGWSLHLGARTEAAEDGSNDFGVDPQAAEAFDPLDLRKPPVPPGPWVRVAFDDRGWERYPGLYRRDLRASGAEGHTWEVEVRSAAAGEAITLDFAALTALPADLAVRVLDREQGSVFDLFRFGRSLQSGGSAEVAAAASSRLALISLGPERPYRIAVVAGTEDYVRRAVEQSSTVPARFALDPVAPNPFREATRIRFGLPRAARARVDVYGLQGERIATLLDRQLEPGFHTLVWDGRRAGGGRAPSGVYLVRLAAGAEVLSRRLVLVR